MESSAIPHFARRFFQEVIHVLVRLRLQSSLRLDALRDLNCGAQAHIRFQFETAAQICLDEYKFVCSNLAHSAWGSGFDRRVPGWTDVLARLLVHYNCTCDKIPQPPALLVQHHADKAQPVEHPGLHVEGSHEVSADCFECIDGPSTFLDYPYPRDSLTRSLAFPDDFENGKVSPVNGKPDEDCYCRSKRFGQEGEK